MREIGKWLSRIADGIAFKTNQFRLLVPGNTRLSVDNWWVAVDARGPALASHSWGVPQASSTLHILDTQENRSLAEQQRLAAELAAMFSLALGRRVDVPLEVAISLPPGNRVLFAPYGQVPDRSVVGPIPEGSAELICDITKKVRRLPEKHQEILGDANGLLDATLLLFDREVRAAYTLLIAGIEVLSRAYGNPPTDWHEWHDSAVWDDMFVSEELTAKQKEAVRQRLMKNQHLRLKATFRSYASRTVSESLWDQSLDEWIYEVDASSGAMREPRFLAGPKIGEILPSDRSMLSVALGHS